jgi:molybdopterin-guanine dinucleotide biosynthesis protein A
MMNRQTKVTGVILAGGLARRMGGVDKGLVTYKDKPMITYAIAAMQPVVDTLLINANRSLVAYRQLGLPVIGDQTDTFDGPLAGIYTAMHYAENEALLVMPCDMPLITSSHLQTLLAAYGQNDCDVAVACDGERMHPVMLALNGNLKTSLADYLGSGQRKVEHWLNQQLLCRVDFSDDPRVFYNVNALSDLQG